MSQQRISFLVHGTVQGVGFRDFTRKRATQHKLTGWVKNTDNEKVTGEAQGSAEALRQFKKDLNDGPRMAHVVKVETKEIEVKSGEDSFRA